MGSWAWQAPCARWDCTEPLARPDARALGVWTWTGGHPGFSIGERGREAGSQCVVSDTCLKRVSHHTALLCSNQKRKKQRYVESVQACDTSSSRTMTPCDGHSHLASGTIGGSYCLGSALAPNLFLCVALFLSNIYSLKNPKHLIHMDRRLHVVTVVRHLPV